MLFILTVPSGKSGSSYCERHFQAKVSTKEMILLSLAGVSVRSSTKHGLKSFSIFLLSVLLAWWLSSEYVNIGLKVFSDIFPDGGKLVPIHHLFSSFFSLC
jgi:hypothetical protein